jgi:hypothetical protein
MKKPILTIIIIMLAFLANAQQSDKFPVNESGQVEYKGVVEVSATKGELYKRCKTWLSKQPSNIDYTIKMDDTLSGIIKIVFKEPALPQHASFRFIYESLIVELKDSKYRYTVTDIRAPQPPYADLTAEDVNKFIDERLSKGKKPYEYLTEYHLFANMGANTIINSLQQGMQEASF